MTNEHDQAELAGLTDAERAALADDDAPTQEVEAVDMEEEAPVYLPPLVAQPLPNAGEILQRLDGREYEIERQFEDGDITAKEYREGRASLAEQRDEVRWRKREAELAENFVETARTNGWNREVETFMTTTAKAITDKGEPALLAFDAIVKKVTSDPANQRLSDRAQLAKAHKMFLKDFGAAFSGPSRDSWEASRDEPTASVDGGKLAQLDRLLERDPLAYEEAIGRLSDAELRAYGL